MVKTNNNIEDLTFAFLNDGLTAQEKLILCQLLKEPVNKAYFKKMYTMWYADSRTQKDEDVEHALQRVLFRINRSERRFTEPVIVRRRFIFRRAVAVAAVAVLVTGAVLYYALKTGEPTYKHLSETFNTEESATPDTNEPINKVTVPFGSILPLLSPNHPYCEYRFTYARTFLPS